MNIYIYIYTMSLIISIHGAVAPGSASHTASRIFLVVLHWHSFGDWCRDRRRRTIHWILHTSGQLLHVVCLHAGACLCICAHLVHRRFCTGCHIPTCCRCEHVHMQNLPLSYMLFRKCICTLHAHMPLDEGSTYAPWGSQFAEHEDDVAIKQSAFVWVLFDADAPRDILFQEGSKIAVAHTCIIIYLSKLYAIYSWYLHVYSNSNIPQHSWPYGFSYPQPTITGFKLCPGSNWSYGTKLMEVGSI